MFGFTRAGVGSTVSDSELAAPEAWHEVGAGGEPAFTNSWVNLGSGLATAAFYKYANRVYLKGTVSAGTAAAAAFTLPAGYRPAASEIFAAASSGVATVTIDSAGAVVPAAGGGGAYTCLDTVSFLVA